MTAFIVIGAFGLLMIVLSLVLDDLFEGLFDAIGIDAGGGLFSTPVIGAFLAAFGFGGALIFSAGTGGALVALVGGLAAGVVIAAVALWMTRALLHMRTDEPFRTADLVGVTATVVTPIPPGGYGEIALNHHGQRMKLNARCGDRVAAGTTVVVTEVASSSSVLVEPEAKFWGSSDRGGT